jgi:acetylornithine deacetylase
VLPVSRLGTERENETVRSSLEEKVVDAVRESQDDLVALTGELIACDTTARSTGEPPRDEAKLQGILQARLQAIGAETEMWEPEAPAADNPMGIPADLSFAGRPQLVARLEGAGGGRSLLLNGHIDAVSVAPLEEWRSDPFRAEIRDGLLFGRGSNDMKGGLASFVVALEVLHRVGARLRGPVVYCANTDEESTGAGGWACVCHGVRADAGLCAEPSGFDAWTSCRGSSSAILRVRGRSGHVEFPQPDWREGGAVNAVEMMLPLLDAVARLRERWQANPEYRHALLSPPGIAPTIISGGNGTFYYPASCDATIAVQYLPGQVDRKGTAARVQAEIVAWVDASTADNAWIAEHPPEWRWLSDFPPREVDPDHELVTTTLDAARDVGRAGHVAGLDSWDDAATFTRFGGTPTISFGPGGHLSAHAVDEFVPVDDLVDHCAASALTVLRWCGV